MGTRRATRAVLGAVIALALALGVLGVGGAGEAAAGSTPYIPMCQFWEEDCN